MASEGGGGAAADEESSRSESAAAHSRSTEAYYEEEDIVCVRRVPGEDPVNVREVRISCPDATGLGCDITRLLLDFGLRILQGDISTDGRWCFLVFRVSLTARVRPHWQLLQQRLEQLCAPTTDWDALTRHSGSAHTRDCFGHPFLLQVASYDRVNVLHDLIDCLWESDCAVFKAHITTSPSKDVLDMFWLFDLRGQLPDTHRALELCDLVRATLGPCCGQCTVQPAPADTCGTDSSACVIRRSACKDVATPASSLRLMAGARRAAGSNAGGSFSEKDEYGEAEAVQVCIDNCSSATYTCVSLSCRNRKGLLYDLMRTLHDMGVRVAYGKVAVGAEACEVDLFVQEHGGGRICDEELVGELRRAIQHAVLLPVRIALRDVYEGTMTELLVTAYLDSGARGRPRVTYDVTAALNELQLCVFMADVFADTEPPANSGVAWRPQELHRFLLTLPDGRPLLGEAQKRLVYEYVHSYLLGVTGTCSAAGGSGSGSGGRKPGAQHASNGVATFPLAGTL